MGDSIERALEETIPILRAAQRAKLLSPAEITEVVRNRRNHEYSVSSRSVTRADFLRYAAFERELAQVIKKRAEKRKLKKRKTQLVIGKSAARVNLVYSRAVKKFHGDDELWLHYAKHCLRTGAERAAGKLFAKAIAFRPDSEKVWLAAVAFHFDNCGDAKGGRAMAQKALRSLPESRLIWKEYFRLELFYLAKLISRRVALGLALTPDEDDHAKEKDGDRTNSGQEGREEEDTIPHNVDGQNPSDADGSEETVPQSTSIKNIADCDSPSAENDERNKRSTSPACEQSAAPTKRKLSFWHGGVPMTVFRNACEKVTFTAENCAEIWNIVASTPFVPVQLMESMATALKERYADYISTGLLDVRLAWDIAHAQFVMRRASGTEQKNGDARKMDNRSADLQSEKNVLAERSEGVFVAMKSVIIAKMANKQNMKESSAAIICLDGFRDLAKTIDESGQIGEKVMALKSQITDEELIAETVNTDQKSSNRPTSSEKLTEFGVNDLIELVVDRKGELSNALFQTLKAKVLVPFRDLKQERVLCEWLSREQDLQRLREACDLFLPLPPKTMGSLRAAIEAEMRLWKHALDQCDAFESYKEEFVTRVRRMFKMATELSAAKRDDDMWLEYIEFERKLAKDSKQANVVLWKASKALDKASAELLTERLTLRNLEP